MIINSAWSVHLIVYNTFSDKTHCFRKTLQTNFINIHVCLQCYICRYWRKYTHLYKYGFCWLSELSSNFHFFYLENKLSCGCKFLHVHNDIKCCIFVQTYSPKGNSNYGVPLSLPKTVDWRDLLNIYIIHCIRNVSLSNKKTKLLVQNGVFTHFPSNMFVVSKRIINVSQTFDMYFLNRNGVKLLPEFRKFWKKNWRLSE